MTLFGSASANTLKPYQGEPLPPFQLEDLEGEKHALGDYHGQVVLVNFWATWCPPCVKEMPSMQRLKRRLAGKPFALLAVNMGEEDDVLSKFLQKVDVDFTIVVDRDGTVTRNWGLFAYPTSFLLDKTGSITNIVHGELQWDSPEVMVIIESLITSASGHRSSNDSPQTLDASKSYDAIRSVTQ